MVNNMDLIDHILQYIVIPVAGFVGYIYKLQQQHHTDIQVLQSRLSMTKEGQDREMREIRVTTDKIFTKLDNIEVFLRK